MDTPASHERRTDEIMLALVQTIQTDVQGMQVDMRNLQVTLAEHTQIEPARWAEILGDMMTKAFPSGDADGHRRDHETRMKLAEEKAAFWAKMGYELKKWGLIGFVLWAAKTLIEAGALWITTGGHIK